MNIKKVITENFVASYFDYSCCEISNVGDGNWYINRVIVDKEKRRIGIGSKLLVETINDILTNYNPESIIVTPGGYNTDPNMQFRFYEKNGFNKSLFNNYVLFYNKLKDIKI